MSHRQRPRLAFGFVVFRGGRLRGDTERRSARNKEVTQMLRFLPACRVDGSSPNSWASKRLLSRAPTRLFRSLRESEDGQAVVELALALPILLIVVLGIVDFGRAVNYWNDENHVANLAARYAAVGTLPGSGATCGGKSTLTA